MHTFREVSGKFSIGHYCRGGISGDTNYDTWVPMFDVRDLSTAVEAVRYLNGGDSGRFHPALDILQS